MFDCYNVSITIQKLLGGIVKNLNLFPSISFFDLLLDVPVYSNSYSKCKFKEVLSSEYKDESGNNYLELDLPGIKKEDVQISVKDNFLEIKAERKSKNTSVERKYTISKNVDCDKISAKMEDGVLTITLPPKNQEKEKPKLIKVE